MSKEKAFNRETIFSECRKHRYTLWREFYSARAAQPPLLPVEGNRAHNFVQIIGLNPSTADEKLDDPTIRRCIDYAKRWGFGALCMTNLFSFRATDPKEMIAYEEPIEFAYENAKQVERIAEGAGLIVCAWGHHGAHMRRAEKYLKHLGKVRKFALHHLGLNVDGSPKHPLYLKKTIQPIPFQLCQQDSP